MIENPSPPKVSARILAVFLGFCFGVPALAVAGIILANVGPVWTGLLALVVVPHAFLVALLSLPAALVVGTMTGPVYALTLLMGDLSRRRWVVPLLVVQHLLCVILALALFIPAFSR